ncbi:MAG: bifunctional oligoribonuclease/PAP phosphatase NrnA [Romboutsia sp.]|nr:bifunctional oligoribonuclease/PAP phosphatase NrnA [Romboutsia sp.]
MYREIYKKIKKYNNIVIARHIGPDPDALASQMALRDSIKLTFPDKNVIAVGSGSSKFSFIGSLDKLEEFDETLLIVTDTPDTKRIDGVDISNYSYNIKIDHHPFIEKFCDIEYIDDRASSACEIIMDLILNTKLKCNKSIAKTLYTGLVSDSNRFLFNTCTPKTFRLAAKYLEDYKFDLSKLYQKLYARPLNEVRLEGYISSNMEVTDNGLGYIKITDKIVKEYGVDAASAGNMVNNYNFIEEVLVWVTMTEDVNNDQIRISIRSRGPAINKVAEKYNGGGHKMAAGVKAQTFTEANKLIKDLDKVVKEYNKERE